MYVWKWIAGNVETFHWLQIHLTTYCARKMIFFPPYKYLHFVFASVSAVSPESNLPFSGIIFNLAIDK